MVASRRVGRPREHWLLNTMEEAYECTTPGDIEPFDPLNEHHLNWLTQIANDRDDSFETKPFNEKRNLFCTKNEEISVAY